jgi:hypothetical protein
MLWANPLQYYYLSLLLSSSSSLSASSSLLEAKSCYFNICSASQEIGRLLQHRNIQCHVPKSLPMVPVQSQTNPLHILTHYFCSFQYSPSIYAYCLQNGLLFSGFSTNMLYVLPYALHDPLIILYLISLIISDKEYRIILVLIMQFIPAFS